MPRRKFTEIKRPDGKVIVSVREKIRRDETTLPSGKRSERAYVTIPKPVAEELKKQGIEYVELQWEKGNPLFFQIIPLKVERLQPAQEQQQEEKITENH